MDNISILELFYDFKRNNSVLWIEGDEIQILISDKLKSQELRNKIVNSKREIREVLLYNEIFSKEDFVNREVFAANANELPLSFAQERLWFIENYEEGTNAYHIPHVYTLNSDTDIEGIKYAVQQIVARHEILRSTYKETHGRYDHVQIVHKEELPVEIIWLSDKDNYKSIIRKDINEPFDLRNEYPIRVKVYILRSISGDVNKAILLINLHHIAGDGWSTDLLHRELLEYYKACIRKDKRFELPQLQIQYKDYALWQRLNLKDESFINQLNYWKDKLYGFQTLAFPTDYPRPKNIDYRGAYINFKLNKELSHKLRLLSRSHCTTFHNLMLASVNVLLSKYTNQNDIVIGSLNAGRHHRQTKDLIGFFVNTQVNRTVLQSSQHFTELVNNVHQAQTDAYAYQDIPFQRLVEALAIEPDTSRHPIFQVMFSMRSFGTRNNNSEERQSYLLPYYEEGDYEVAQFDLAITIDDSQEEVVGELRYATGLFRKETILKLSERYTYLLEQLANLPDSPYSKICLLDTNEYQKIVFDWNTTDSRFTTDKSICELFEAQVKRTPNDIALVFEERGMTYKELNERSNQLARHIHERYKNAGHRSFIADRLIALCMERNLDMIVSILAVLKTGGAYVPIDPEYPQGRIDYILTDSNVEFIIIEGKSVKNFQERFTENQIICVDGTENFYSTQDTDDLVFPGKLTDLAYVIYTSGTTGRPKGVMVEHGAFSQFICNFNSYLSGKIGLTKKNILSLSNYVFDIFGLEYALPLITGGKIRLSSVDMIKEEYFLDKPIIQQTPSTLLNIAIEFQDRLSDITCLVGGEALQPNIAEQLNNTFEKVINVYGPTETVIWSTAYELVEPVKPYIGKALSDEKMYILDQHLVPVPIGHVGELYIGGAGLSRGYLNQPDLTEQRFIPNPFATMSDKAKGFKQLYKTGDLVRWLSDGNIEYVGRNDDQVKIHGYRIEQGEIESALLAVKGVKQVCILVKERKTGENRLKYMVAYYTLSVPGKLTDENSLREELRKILPEYMIPAVFVELECFPLTISGKLDKRSLPDPEFKAEEEYLAPQTNEERIASEIWKDVLGLELVGVKDNFFRIGGNSISAIRVSHRMSTLLGCDVKVSDIFRCKTISEILIHRMGKLRMHISKVDCDNAPLSFAQERLWFIEQYEGGTNAYHMPGVYKVNVDIDLKGLKYALQQIVSRHEILRTTIEQKMDGQNRRQIVNKDPIQIEEIFLNDTDDHCGIIRSEINTPFDLSKEYPIRIKLFFINTADVLSEKEQPTILLVITMHHIATDGWSMQIFQREFLAYYDAYVKGEMDFNLPTLEIQYSDFAHWQRNYLSGEILEKQLNYWRKRLSGYQTLNVPTDYVRPHTVDYRGANQRFILNKQLSRRLRDLSQRTGSTLHSVMLSGIAILLSKYSGQDDIIIGSDIAGRHHSQTESLIGFFVNMQANRILLSKDQNFNDLIKYVQLEQVECQQYQDLPFEKLVNELGVERDESRHPLFQVTFAVQSFAGSDEIPEKQKQYFAPYQIENAYDIEKFDLSIGIDDSGIELVGQISYAVSLFKSETITRFIGHYVHLMEELANAPDTPYNEISLLSREEYQIQLNKWNATEREYPANDTVCTLFEKQVERTPHHTALIHNGRQVSYKELNEKSNQLARYIREQYKLRTHVTLTADSLIAICMDRSVEIVVSILAILKAGAAYVPIDPNYPQERVDYMLSDTNAELVLTKRSFEKRMKIKLPNERVIYTEQTEALYDDQIKTNLLKYSRGNDLAYVIYTSGSTGKPKGVMIEHAGMLNHLHAKIDLLTITDKSVVIQNASQSFDISVWQFLAALMCGGKILIYDEELVFNPGKLMDAIKQDQATILEVVPSYLSAMLDLVHENNRADLNSLEFVLVTGEELKSDLVSRWFNTFPGRKLINAYGPTEASDDITHHILNEYDGSRFIPIGKPVQNLKIYIVDDFMQLNPIGVKGEICVSGIGVGRGYLNNELKTKEVFVNDPFAVRKNIRMYKTGDIGKWLPDGSILYMGRKDEQVKIRGHRIELGEIEHALLQIKGLKQACVLARERKTGKIGSKYLIGYYVLEDQSMTLSATIILDKLNLVLPEYMVPLMLIGMEAFPLTSNGKLNKQGLPDPDWADLTEDYLGPQNETETILCDIWQDVLGLERISVNDDFFKIGGDSILSIQVSGRIRQSGFNCQVKEIFECKTIAKLAKILNKKILVSGIHSEQGVLTGSFNLLPIQEWFLEQVDSGKFAKPGHWNQSFIIKVPALEQHKLKDCIKELVFHHDVLRITFTNDNPLPTRRDIGAVHWNQTYQPDIILPELKALDVRNYNEMEIHHLLTDWQSDFDIEHGPLFRVGYLFGYEDGSARIYFAFHHLIIDAVSWRIVCDDLKTLYEGKKLLSKGSSYRQWVSCMEKYALSHPEESTYWQSQLEGIPTYHSVNARPDLSAASFELEKDLTTYLLHDAPAAYHTEINDLLLTGLAYVLMEMNQSNIQGITLEGHGRENIDNAIDHSKTVGWFTTAFPVRLVVQDNIGDSIKQIKEHLRSLPNKGIGFGSLFRANKSEFADRILPQVSFNYLGQFDMQAEKYWQIVAEVSGASVHPENISHYMIDINGSVSNGYLRFHIATRFGEAVTKQFCRDFKASLINVIQHCRMKLQNEGSSFTPSDFNSVHLDQFRIDQLENQARKNKNEIEAIFPANSLQQGFVYHALSQKEDDAYRVQVLYDYREAVNIVNYLKAWEYCILEYPILRTAFNWEKEIIQIVYKHGKLYYELHDISHLKTQEEKDKEITKIQEHDRKRSFDLSQVSLFRIHIIKQSNDFYTILENKHHSITDGWSAQMLLSRLSYYYHTLNASSLPVTKVDKAYLLTQEYIASHKETVLDYWKKRIGEMEAANDISALLSNPINLRIYRQNEKPAKNRLIIDNEFYNSIKTFTQKEGLTTNVIVQFIWHKLIQVYSNSPKTIVGTTVSGRDLPIDGIAESVGMFINTLPLIINWDEKTTIKEQLHGIHKSITEMNTHSFVELSKLQGKGERLFHSFLGYENYPMAEKTEEGAKISFRSVIEKGDYPLIVVAYEYANALIIELVYDRNYLEENLAKKHLSTLKDILRQIITDPDNLYTNITLLDAREYKMQVEDWNATEKNYPLDKTVIELFEEQAFKTPANIAVTFEDKQLTYHELNEQSDKLAEGLIQMFNVQKNELIGIMLDKSEKVVVSMLAISKSGGAFVFIDPDYPSDRKQFIIEDTSLKVLITQSDYIFDLGFCTASLLAIDIQQESINELIPKFKRNVKPNDLAYVIYTSGTTGKPKGVMLEHRSLSNLVFAQKNRLDIDTGSRVLQFASMMFDASVWEIVSSLVFGAELFVVPAAIRQNADLLSRYIERNKITIATLPPALLSVLPLSSYPHLKTLVVAGETCPLDIMTQWSVNRNLINAYGPTESTVCATMHEFKPGDLNTNIGKPIDNMKIYVLDSFHKPLPVGVIGELYIGGAGVARGYLNREDLTRERFINNPFDTNKNKAGGCTKLYKTGDLVRWLADGNLEYIARNDDQVKIRGHRIELQEIEYSLQRIKGIKQASVQMKERRIENKSDRYLIGYYIPEKDSVLSRANYIRKLLDDKIRKNSINYEILDMDVSAFSYGRTELEFLHKEIFKSDTYLSNITIDDGDCIFDIGANIGMASVFFARQAKKLRIYSFEPIDRLYDVLNMNLFIHSKEASFKTFNFGVGSVNKKNVPFSFFKNNTAMSTQYPNKEDDRQVLSTYLNNTSNGADSEQLVNFIIDAQERILCEIRTLSRIIKDENIERIDLLKIDVEKAELDVINGLDKNDWNKIRQIVIEVHDTDGRLETIQSILLQNGYEVKTLQETDLQNSGLFVVYGTKSIASISSKKLNHDLINNDNPVYDASEAYSKYEAKKPILHSKDLHNYLKMSLPGYMIPDVLVELESFPLAINGKLDRAALPDGDFTSSEDYVAPTTEQERICCDIWKEVLGVERVGITDNFFRIGGNSILAIQVSHRISKALKRNVKVSDMFKYTTINMLNENIALLEAEGVGWVI